MNRLQELFRNKKNNILNIYFTAGYPALHDTVDIIKALDDSNADMVEIGMPYSDPLADGPTIQASSSAALKNGMNLELLFNQIAEARTLSRMPFILMGYFNQVMQYGEEKFVQKAKSVGVDCLILPDLPVEEYEKHFHPMFRKHDMDIAFLITPRTPDSRIRHIDAVTNSFIYMVSSNAITGARAGIEAGQKDYFKRIDDMKLRNPRLIGFGISNKETFTTACVRASGAIIGSAFINALEGEGSIDLKVKKFISKIIG
ncbi:MAG: tryptophan synthase subunit alpha [Saprospiraceae bacterium]|nr:tryptophan synthase subunit alpha [Saprospiraceae bacterium]